MWRVVRRAMLPILVLGVGVAALVYGVSARTAHVYEDKEIEIPIPVMMAPGFGGPPGMGGMPDFPGAPSDMPAFGAPVPVIQKIKQTVAIGKDEPEMAIVRDVTIGGLMLLDSGALKRTYRGEAPKLCPT